ncbi:MAG TPA: hypothetical protein VL943_13055 [Niabella sp.]|nr:hypothetical protein [Niabella sp.]
MTHYKDFMQMRLVIGCLLSWLLLACTKTEQEQIKRPYNSIERFSMPGYGDLDSISAVLKSDTILVYWNAESAPPATIRPQIDIATAASIIPASGAEVAFDHSTVYTVTAEDGTARKYILKPVFNKAIPRLLQITAPFQWTWEGNFNLTINGLYLFTNGGVSGIKVYAQRLRDGYEFNLPLNNDLTTSTQINLKLPRLTADLDSGLHRIWLQVGDLPSNYLDVWISQPWIDRVVTSVRLKEAGGPVYLGDTLTLVYNHTLANNELFNKYFKKENILLNNLGCFKTFNQYINDAPIVSFTNAELKFVLSADKFRSQLGAYIAQSILYYNYQSDAAGTIQYSTNAAVPMPAETVEIARKTIISERP